MRMLILTQKVDINDDVLGFFHRWIIEFAKNCERVTIICLHKGEYDLPENVRVYSLGKEKNNFQSVSRRTIFKKFKYIFNFYRFVWRERKNYDGVFVHMNHEYVILGAPLWKIMGKKIGLWYAHGKVSLSLRVAEKLSDVIFTSTESGFRIKSGKVKVVGQGIDINKFNPSADGQKSKVKSEEDKRFKIVTVGRISPIKDYEILIKAVEILDKKGLKLQVDIIGQTDSGQKIYLENLKKMVSERKLENVINFLGSVPNKDLPFYLERGDIFVNMSHTGSLDKAILEAMACGLPVISSNEALLSVLGDYKDLLMFEKNNHNQLAEKIEYVIGLSDAERKEFSEDMRDIVIKDHNVEGFIRKIAQNYNLS